MMKAFFVCLLLAALGDPFQHDLQYIAKLRSESFLQLSRQQGEQMLARAELSALDRAQVLIELSKTCAAQALNSRPPQRNEFWLQAVQVIERELQTQPAPGIQVLLSSQLGFLKEQQAAWTLRESEIRAQTDDDWELARRQLREAIKVLRHVQTELRSPDVRRQKTLSDARLASLERNIEFQLANAFLNQGVAYANHSQDRVNALTQAMGLLTKLASGRVDDELAWKSRIQQVRCLRLLGQYAQAQQALQKLSSAPATFLGSVAAESIRLALDVRNLEAAMQLAANQQIDSRDPEFQLARVQAFVTAAEQLRGQPRSTEFQQQATEIVASLSHVHGVYWVLRGEIQLSRLAKAEDADAGLLSNAAETMLRQDSPESAQEMFRRAAEQAVDRGATDQAFDSLYKAALIDHRESHLQPAIDQLRHVAVTYPDHPQAAEAHLLAVFDGAGRFQELANAKASGSERALTQYEGLLAEHLERWPDGSSADQVRIWAAKLAVARRQWQNALSLYQAVSRGSTFELEAYRSMGQVTDQWFATGQPTDPQRETLKKWLQHRIDAGLPPTAHQLLALQAAKLELHHHAPDFKYAERILAAAPPNADGVQTDLRQELDVLSIVATCGSGRTAAARARLTQLVPLPLDALLTLARELQSIRAERLDDAELRQLTLELHGMLQPHLESMNEQDRLTVERAAADYMETDQAVEAYRRFAENSPQDLNIQLRYAELLSGIHTRDAQHRAMQQWRFVGQLSPKRSQTWFRVKLGIAQAHYELGERDKARDLIAYLSALYPDLGGENLKARFAELARRVARP